MIASTNLPDFFIIGAARSGTTALYQYLTQHPEISMSDPKEPHYFALCDHPLDFQGPGDAETINRKAIIGAAEYGQLFAHMGEARARGEASVSYLYYSEAARRIRECVPGARLICLLRNPVERAFSAYSFLRTRLFEPEEDFRVALADEPRRIRENWHHLWHYRAMGQYDQQLPAYLERFPSEQIRYFLYDEFQRDPQSVLTECFRFLQVNPNFIPRHTPSPHFSGKPRNRFLSRLLTREHPLKTMLKPLVPQGLRHRLRGLLGKANVERVGLEPELRRTLRDDFRPGILRLQELIGKDLSNWIE